MFRLDNRKARSSSVSAAQGGNLGFELVDAIRA